MAVASAGPYASLHLAPDRQPRQYPTSLFLQAGCTSCRPTNSVKALTPYISTVIHSTNNVSKISHTIHQYCHSQSCQLLYVQVHLHPFNGPLSGTTRVGQYQKGKTNLDFTEARDSEWQWHQLGHMQVCTSLQADNHTSTPPLSFLQAGCPS